MMKVHLSTRAYLLEWSTGQLCHHHPGMLESEIGWEHLRANGEELVVCQDQFVKHQFDRKPSIFNFWSCLTFAIMYSFSNSTIKWVIMVLEVITDIFPPQNPFITHSMDMAGTVFSWVLTWFLLRKHIKLKKPFFLFLHLRAKFWKKVWSMNEWMCSRWVVTAPQCGTSTLEPCHVEGNKSLIISVTLILFFTV